MRSTSHSPETVIIRDERFRAHIHSRKLVWRTAQQCPVIAHITMGRIELWPAEQTLKTPVEFLNIKV